MKNKKLIIAAIALVAVVGILLGVYFATRPKPVEGGKSITVTVIHKDKTEKTFTYQTDAEFLGTFLKEQGLIVESASAGMYDIVDGEKADYSVDQGYWNFLINGEVATEGMNTTPITDGAVYSLVYTIYEG